MRTCIWCCRNEPTASFIKKAHTFPASLGGNSICGNVCDDCNHYFGSPTSTSPSVEVVFKEILNLSKYLLLMHTKDKPIKRYKSEYFKLDMTKAIIKVKPRYTTRPHFQETIGRLFKRGMFKVFLEEREVQKGDALNDRFNFIREFARYNLNDYPVYYFQPKFQAIFFSKPDTISPTIRFTDYSDKIDAEFRFFEYGIMAHNFAIPTSKLYTLQLEKFRKSIVDRNHPFGLKLIEIQKVTDIDFTFSFLK